MMDSSSVRFSDFQLDPARRELWRGGERLRLPVRVFDCIAYLVEHRDRAVGRDELIRAIWGQAEVSDNVLDQTVLRARRILGDTGRQRRIILTKPRYGYVWGIPVDAVTDAEATSESAPAATPVSPSRYWLWSVLACGALVVIAAAVKLMFSAADPADTLSSQTTRALVMPVVTDAGPDYAWVRLGLMDLIAQRLQTAGLTVVPSDNVVALVRSEVSLDSAQIRSIAELTGAGLVLTADARQGEQQWRVTLRLMRDAEEALTSIGESSDIVAAARIATDIMARYLGLEAIPGIVPAEDEAVVGLLQQVEAAMLADDIETANVLLEQLDPSQQHRSDVRYQRAMINFRLGRLADSAAELETLLDLDSVQADRRFHARVLNSLSNVLLRQNKLTAAEARVNAAVGLLEDDRPSRELGRALTGRAVIQSSQSQYAAALTDFARARVVLESTGDYFALARVNANIGILETRRDRLAEAVPILADAADRLAVFHDLSSELYTRVSLSLAHLLRREPAAALAQVPRLRELRANDPDQARQRYAALAMAQVLFANGQLQTGDEILQQALQSADAEDDHALSGWARAIAAEQEYQLGNHAEALRLATQALIYDQEDEHARVGLNLHLLVIQAHLARGDLERARAQAAMFAQWLSEAEPTPVVHLYQELADALVAEDDASAQAVFERALKQAEAGRVADDLLRVSAAYADFLIKHGRLDRAGEVVARTADWAGRDYEAALLQLRLYHALAQPTAWHQSLKRAEELAGERRLPPHLLVIPTVTN